MRWVFGFFIATIYACKSPPKAEMERAKKALEDARKVSASHYAPSEFQKAQESYEKAEKQVLEKEYDEAKKNAQEAEKLAQKSYHTSLDNFTKEKKRLVEEAKLKAKLENASLLYGDKFTEAEILEKELSQKMEDLKNLSLKLKNLEESKAIQEEK